MSRLPTTRRASDLGPGSGHRRGSYRWVAGGPGYRVWGAGVWEERVSFGGPVTVPGRRSAFGRAVWWAVRLLQLAVGAGAAVGAVRSLERPRNRSLPEASPALPRPPRALPPGR